MRKSFFALAVVAALLLTASVPASAQTWIQLRYWSTSDSWNNGTFTPTFNSNLWGFSLRRDVLGGMWALSFNIDSGPVTNYSAGSLGTDAFNRFWNLNLHRNFSVQNSRLSLFGGWGSAALEGPTGGVFLPYYVRQTGPRLGADVRMMFMSDWYLSAHLGHMFGGSATQFNWTAAGLSSVTASLTDWRVGVGRSFGTWEVEGGYRGINWSFTPSPMCLGASPCNFRWGGWYVGLGVTMP